MKPEISLFSFFLLISILSIQITNAVSVDHHDPQIYPHIRLFRRVLNETTVQRRRLLDFFYTAPTAGETRVLGYFYALVYIGSPPQRTTLIIDTGSSICATPCYNCKNCGNHLNPPFNPLLSKTIRPMSCKDKTNPITCSTCKNEICYFTQRYLEGSTLSGPVYRDHMWLGGNILVNNSHIPIGDEYSLIHYSIIHPFGCSERVTGLFASQLADGIIGLAPRKNSYLMNLFSQRSTIYKSFSLCFEDDGGLIVFGGHDHRLDSTPMCYTKLYISTGYYRVRIENVFWNDKRALENKQYWNRQTGVLVDSGTSFTYLNHHAFKKFIEVFKSESKRLHAPLDREQRLTGETLCYGITIEDVKKFPTLYLIFESGCRYHISPLDYFFYKSRNNVYCVGIYSDPTTVIGNNIMNKHHFYFDIQKSVLGISEAKCSTPANAKQDYYDLTTRYNLKSTHYSPTSSPIQNNLYSPASTYINNIKPSFVMTSNSKNSSQTVVHSINQKIKNISLSSNNTHGSLRTVSLVNQLNKSTINNSNIYLFNSKNQTILKQNQSSFIISNQTKSTIVHLDTDSKIPLRIPITESYLIDLSNITNTTSFIQLKIEPIENLTIRYIYYKIQSNSYNYIHLFPKEKGIQSLYEIDYDHQSLYYTYLYILVSISILTFLLCIIYYFIFLREDYISPYYTDILTYSSISIS